MLWLLGDVCCTVAPSELFMTVDYPVILLISARFEENQALYFKE
jgi:hypothetical protein